MFLPSCIPSHDVELACVTHTSLGAYSCLPYSFHHPFTLAIQQTPPLFPPPYYSHVARPVSPAFRTRLSSSEMNAAVRANSYSEPVTVGKNTGWLKTFPEYVCTYHLSGPCVSFEARISLEDIGDCRYGSWGRRMLVAFFLLALGLRVGCADVFYLKPCCGRQMAPLSGLPLSWFSLSASEFLVFGNWLLVHFIYNNNAWKRCRRERHEPEQHFHD